MTARPLASLLVAAMAGCAGSSTAPSTPVGTPAESIDSDHPMVVTEFVRNLLDPTHGLHAEMTGSVRDADTGLDEGVTWGHIDTIHDDEDWLFVLQMPGRSGEYHRVRVNGQTFLSVDNGPYLEVDVGGRLAFRQLLRLLLADARDASTAAGAGALRHIVPAAPVDVDPASVGFDPAEVADLTATFDGYAGPDGVPKSLSIRLNWTQLAGMLHLEQIENYELTLRPVVIEVPEDTWSLYTSELYPYQIAHPRGWAVDSRPADLGIGRPAVDAFVGPQVTVRVMVLGIGANSPDVFLDQTAVDLAQQCTVDAVGPISVAGLDGRFFTCHGPIPLEAAPGVVLVTDRLLLEAILVMGEYAWDIEWYGPLDDPEGQRRTFETMLDSLRAAG